MLDDTVLAAAQVSKGPTELSKRTAINSYPQRADTLDVLPKRLLPTLEGKGR